MTFGRDVERDTLEACGGGAAEGAQGWIWAREKFRRPFAPPQSAIGKRGRSSDLPFLTFEMQDLASDLLFLTLGIRSRASELPFAKLEIPSRASDLPFPIA